MWLQPLRESLHAETDYFSTLFRPLRSITSTEAVHGLTVTREVETPLHLALAVACFPTLNSKPISPAHPARPQRNARQSPCTPRTRYCGSEKPFAMPYAVSRPLRGRSSHPVRNLERRDASPRYSQPGSNLPGVCIVLYPAHTSTCTLRSTGCSSGCLFPTLNFQPKPTPPPSSG
jgi:hypothetical protein